jgi:hypothetical protein
MSRTPRYCEHGSPVMRIEWGPLVSGLPNTWRRITHEDGCVRTPMAEGRPALADALQSALHVHDTPAPRTDHAAQVERGLAYMCERYERLAHITMDRATRLPYLPTPSSQAASTGQARTAPLWPTGRAADEDGTGHDVPDEHDPHDPQ